MLFNILFLGVPVVILAIDRWVAIYNGIAVFGVILIAMVIIRGCFCKRVTLPDLSNYLYLLTSLWLTGLITWATVAVHQNKYDNIGMVENGYFDYIAGVLIACNPLFLLMLFALIGCACILASSYFACFSSSCWIRSTSTCSPAVYPSSFFPPLLPFLFLVSVLINTELSGEQIKMICFQTFIISERI